MRLASDPTENLVEGQIYYNTTDDEFRGYNNGAWRAIAHAVTVEDLNDLDDVDIDSPTNRQLFIYDSADSEWKNDDLVAGDIPNLPATKITSGLLP